MAAKKIMTSEALRVAINELFGNNIDECGEVSPDLDRQILKLIATSLPEKKDERLNKISDGPHHAPQLIDIEARGYNKAHQDFRKLLGGGDK